MQKKTFEKFNTLSHTETLSKLGMEGNNLKMLTRMWRNWSP